MCMHPVAIGFESFFFRSVFLVPRHALAFLKESRSKSCEIQISIYQNEHKNI